MALKLIWTLVQEQGISQIQIYGDSLPMIQWMKGEFNLHNFTLQPLFHGIFLLKSMFSHIFFMHVYRGKNNEADMLSKNGVAMEDH
jgi:hypothetical protein